MATGTCASATGLAGDIFVSANEGTQLYELREAVTGGSAVNSGWINVRDYSGVRVTIKVEDGVNTDADALTVYGEFTSDDSGAAQSDSSYRQETDRYEFENPDGSGDLWRTYLFEPQDEWFRLLGFVTGAPGESVDAYIKIIGRNNLEQRNSHKLDSSISAQDEGQVTNSILKGRELDDELNDLEQYSDINKLSYGALSVGDSVHNAVAVIKTIPSGSSVSIDSTLNTEPNVYDSGWISRNGFHSQLAHIKGNRSVDVYLLNAEDSDGTRMTGNTAPFATTVANDPTVGGAQLFQDYFRIVVVNTSGSTFTGHIQSTFTHQPLGSIVNAIDQPIFDFFTAPLTQTIIKGKNEETGTYSKVNLSKDDALFVANANRLSEVKGRQHVDATGSVTNLITGATELIYTVPVGKVFQLTSFELTVTNTLSAGGLVTVTDGGGTRRQYVIGPATNQTEQILSIFQDYSEPLPFEEDVTINLPAVGLGEAAFNIIGYTEPA